MPRTNYLRNPAQERGQRVQEIIFGTGVNKRQIKAISTASGIPESTLNSWRRKPDIIPLHGICTLVDVLKVPPEEAGYLLTGRR